MDTEPKELSDEEVNERVAEASRLLDEAEWPECTLQDRQVLMHQVWRALEGIPATRLLGCADLVARRHRLTMQVTLEREERLRKATGRSRPRRR